MPKPPSMELATVAGSKPTPSSSTVSVARRPETVDAHGDPVRRECLRVLVSASWTTRSSWTSERGLSARRVSPSHVSVADDAGLAAVLAQVLAQRALEAVVLAHRLAQAEDRLPDVAVRLVRGLGDRRELGGHHVARLVLGPAPRATGAAGG